jgi:anti-sigma factor RsiW
MKEELQLKLQAYLDGELPSGEAREVADLIACDTELRSLHAELNNTRGVLKAFESGIKLPESREFYWSKIKREIDRLEKPPQVEEPAWLSVWLRRFLAPAGAVAALVIAATLIMRQTPVGQSSSEPETVTAFADSDAFTYRDYSTGMTLVWLPYPAENGFADVLPGDTLN